MVAVFAPVIRKAIQSFHCDYCSTRFYYLIPGRHLILGIDFRLRLTINWYRCIPTQRILLYKSPITSTLFFELATARRYRYLCSIMKWCLPMVMGCFSSHTLIASVFSGILFLLQKRRLPTVSKKKIYHIEWFRLHFLGTKVCGVLTVWMVKISCLSWT